MPTSPPPVLIRAKRAVFTQEVVCLVERLGEKFIEQDKWDDTILRDIPSELSLDEKKRFDKLGHISVDEQIDFHFALEELRHEIGDTHAALGLNDGVARGAAAALEAWAGHRDEIDIPLPTLLDELRNRCR